MQWPSLHDATLSTIQLRWSDGTALFEVVYFADGARRRGVIRAAGVMQLTCPRASAWGESDAINSASLQEENQKTSQQLLEASRAGTVVVVFWDGAVRVLDTCKLAGPYTEVAGEAGSGRFWASHRTLFRPGELSEGCAAATHSVAAFAVGTSGAFSAILIPLPCPSTADARPAEGCVGRGLTGPERLERALKLRKRGSSTSPVSEAFEAYALFSEDRTGRDFLHGLASRQDADCSMSGQVSALGFQVELPTIDLQRSWDECEYQPAYLGCFPGLFDPAPGEPHGCWRPVKP